MNEPRSEEEQRQAYLKGERGNPLTSTTRGGRILSAMQVPWFTIRSPQGYGVVTTIGRRTAKKGRTCVRAIRTGDRAYLVSLPGPYSGWIRNVREHPEVELRIRGGRFRGRALVIVNPDVRAEAERTYCGTLNRFDRAAYRMHRRGKPTPDRIRDLLEHWFRVGIPWRSTSSRGWRRQVRLRPARERA